jgi:hypothetical protein
MLAVVTVVDDGGDARRAPQGVIFLCLAHFKRLTEQHHKYRCFWRLTGQTPRYVPCFLSLETKPTVFTVVFGQRLAKILVFTQFIMLQEITVPCKSHKTPVIYSVSGLLF